jgi:hypothetical protein
MPALGTFSSRGFGQAILMYRLQLGTKTPTLGAGGATWTPSGWTSLQNASADDAFVTVTIPSFIINSTTYTSAFVGSNTYITFGSGSTVFSSLGAATPALNKFHLGAADNSYQRVAFRNSPRSGAYTRIRYEGNGSTSGTLGSPGIVYEATFFNMADTGGIPVLEVLFGNHNRTAGAAGVASTSAYYATPSPAGFYSANQSYVFMGNNTSGTSWTIYTGYYLAGTDY